jgi:hypothetical protein
MNNKANTPDGKHYSSAVQQGFQGCLLNSRVKGCSKAQTRKKIQVQIERCAV